MKYVIYTVLMIFFWDAIAQTKDLSAVVVNSLGSQPMSNVNVLNLNKVKGTATNDRGEFTISTEVNDTLFFSFLGYKSIKVRVTNDMFKIKTRVTMTKLAYALEEVVVRPYKLTGDLYIDARNIPVNIAPRYSISGLPTTGYEGGHSFDNVMAAIFNPIDFLYKVFGAHSKEMRKLNKIRQDTEIRRILADKFDRETLMMFLNIDQSELESILRNCDYSKGFIKVANDLQILEAIGDCYEEYKNASRSLRR